jgi:hypothetical protein
MGGQARSHAAVPARLFSGPDAGPETQARLVSLQQNLSALFLKGDTDEF